MDYEKKYKDALERARQFSEHPLQEDSSNIVEYIFPELQESKDERIRKEIIETFKILGDGKIPVDINYADIFTWLEKQGEQKPAWSEEDISKVQRICKYLDEAKKYYADINEVRECMDWLKSLKDRVQPIHEYSDTEKQEMFIRSQRPHFWRPSEEQLRELRCVISGCSFEVNILIELEEQLKKLL